MGREGERVLIDIGPEFRMQAIRADITGIDAVLLTHSHADHIHGLDDLRPLTRDKVIPIYGNHDTIKETEERFSYVFSSHISQRGGGLPKLRMEKIEDKLQIGSLEFTPLPVKHGILDILGWGIREKGSEEYFIYLTDTSTIPEKTISILKSFPHKTLIIDGLRVRRHETHFTFEQALEAAYEIGAEKIYLTHICHEHDHKEIEEICKNFSEKYSPENKRISAQPAWDGLELESMLSL